MYENYTKMAFLVLFALAVSTYGTALPTALEHTAYGYLEEYGVPLAKEIRAAEEGELANPESSRIIGGTASTLGQFPFQAGLIIELVGVLGDSICGGSLISANRVLTAAHCWFDGRTQAWRVTVVLGSIRIFTGGNRQQSFNVVTHTNWNPTLANNDIAIIRIPVSVAYTANIRNIALPTGTDLTQSFDGFTTTTTGFGLTAAGTGVTATQGLRHAVLSVISNAVCHADFPIILQPTNICTSGANGRGPCAGDSGGPLFLPRNNITTLIGITSFRSPLGCDARRPTAYTRVTSYAEWIRLN